MPRQRMVRFDCTACGGSHKVPWSMRGKSVTCKLIPSRRVHVPGNASVVKEKVLALGEVTASAQGLSPKPQKPPMRRQRRGLMRRSA